MRVLGIETSCDETGIAIYDTERGLLADALYSQIEMHAEYGGVVLELASRDHGERRFHWIRQVFADAKLSFADVDAVAYTFGPGPAGALLVELVLDDLLGFGISRLSAYNIWKGIYWHPCWSMTMPLSFPLLLC